MKADVFARLGLFVQRDFLTADERSALRAEMDGGFAKLATVSSADSEEVDEGHRRTRQVRIPPEAARVVEERFAEVTPDLSRHFGLELTGSQDPQFLVYRQGDFFGPHRDRSDESADYVQNRRLTSVVFVNGERNAGDSEGYSGGQLTFFGLFDEGDEKVGLPLEGEPGLLVAFKPEVIHSVSPVTGGERYSIVNWFV